MFQGSIPALVTPFKGGELDLDSFEALIEWHIAEGSSGFVPVGTTGESPTLSHAEHDEVVAACVRITAGRVPVIAGAGSNSTRETVRLVEAAKSSGADAALVVTPYYNKPTQAGLIAHFEAAAEVGLPIIIYNIPPRSVVDMTPTTMAALSRVPNIIGVKDATADLARVAVTREMCGTEFLQLSGEDPTAVGYNAMGGKGCISVTANVAPRLCAEMQAATLAGDYGKALEYQDRLIPLHRAIFAEPGLCGAKYGLSLLGRCTDEVRRPHVPVSDPVKAQIGEAMRFAGLIN